MTKPTLTSALTAATAILTVLAALPAQLGEISTIIPEQAKSTIVTAGLIAGAILHVLHSMQVQNSAASPQSPASPLFIVGFVLAFLAGASIACSTNTGNPSKDRTARITDAVLADAGDFVGRVALATLTNAASGFAAGDKVDLAHSAAAGLWSQSSSIVTSADVQRIISAWSGDQLDTVAAAAAAAYRQAAPQTQRDRSAVVNRLAQSISTAALDAPGLP